jgi:6-phosphogluconolactonase
MRVDYAEDVALRATIGPLTAIALAAACASSPAAMSEPNAAEGGTGGGPANGGDEAAGDGAAGPARDASPEALGGGASAQWVAYASGYSPDIQVLSVSPQTGALTLTSSVASFGTSPSFLAVDAASKHLYAVDENTPGQVGAYDIDPATGALTFLNAVSSGGDGPPFVAVDGPWVFVANYTSGTVAVLPVESDGSLGAAVDTETVGSLAHMIVSDPTDHFVFVPCKGSDYVAQFSFDASTGKLTPNAVPHMATATGAGPRHLAFHPNGTIAYLIDETDSTMSELSLDPNAGTLSILQTLSSRAAGATGTNTAAEVHVHPAGHWLFGSNRGDDNLVVFALDASGRMSAPTFTGAGGMTPRDFALDQAGAFLYTANQGTGNVVTFRFDASAGVLTPTGSTVAAPSASFIGLVALP